MRALKKLAGKPGARHALSTLRLVAIALAVVAAAMATCAREFRLNLSLSEPVGVYRMVPGQPGRGDVVGFCLSPNNPFTALAKERGYLGRGTCPLGQAGLLKDLAGLPGDRVEVKPEGIYLNGQLLPNTARPAKDSRGRALPPSLLNDGVIPEGRALTISSRSGYSFDSRHFGLVPLALLTRLKPLITFEQGGKHD